MLMRSRFTKDHSIQRKSATSTITTVRKLLVPEVGFLEIEMEQIVQKISASVRYLRVDRKNENESEQTSFGKWSQPWN